MLSSRGGENRRARQGESAGVCPVGRVNADRLHETVLTLLARGAAHRSFVHRAVAEGGQWARPAEALIETRVALARRRAALERQAANLTRAVAEGRALESLLPALERVQKERAQVDKDLADAEQAVADATVERPTAQEIQEAWAEMLGLWQKAPESERELMMQSLVARVEVESKGEAVVEIVDLPAEWVSMTKGGGKQARERQTRAGPEQRPGEGFAFGSRLGAGLRLSPTYSLPPTHVTVRSASPCGVEARGGPRYLGQSADCRIHDRVTSPRLNGGDVTASVGKSDDMIQPPRLPNLNSLPQALVSSLALSSYGFL